MLKVKTQSDNIGRWTQVEPKFLSTAGLEWVSSVESKSAESKPYDDKQQDVLANIASARDGLSFFLKSMYYARTVGIAKTSEHLNSLATNLSQILSMNVKTKNLQDFVDVSIFQDIILGSSEDSNMNLYFNATALRQLNADAQAKTHPDKELINAFVDIFAMDVTAQSLNERFTLQSVFQNQIDSEETYKNIARILQFVYYNLLVVYFYGSEKSAQYHHISPILFICDQNPPTYDKAQISSKKKVVNDAKELLQLLINIFNNSSYSVTDILLQILIRPGTTNGRYTEQQGSRLDAKLRTGIRNLFIYRYGALQSSGQRGIVDGFENLPILNPGTEFHMKDINVPPANGIPFGREQNMYLIKYNDHIFNNFGKLVDKLILFDSILTEDTERTSTINMLYNVYKSFKLNSQTVSDTMLLSSLTFFCEAMVGTYQTLCNRLEEQFKRDYHDFKQTVYDINLASPNITQDQYDSYHTINIDTIALLLLQDKPQLDPFYVDPRVGDFVGEGNKQLVQMQKRKLLDTTSRGFSLTESFVNMPSERKNKLRLQANMFLRAIEFVLPVFQDGVQQLYKYLKENYFERLVSQAGDPRPFLGGDSIMSDNQRLKLLETNFFKTFQEGDRQGVFTKKCMLEGMYEMDEDEELFLQHLYAAPEKTSDTIPVAKEFIKNNIKSEMDVSVFQNFIEYISRVLILQQNLFFTEEKQFINSQKPEKKTKSGAEAQSVGHTDIIPFVIASNGVIPFSLDNFLNVIYFTLAKLSGSAGKQLLKQMTLPFRFYTLKELNVQYALRGFRGSRAVSCDLEKLVGHSCDAGVFDCFQPADTEFNVATTLLKDEMGDLGFADTDPDIRDNDVACFFGLRIQIDQQTYNVSAFPYTSGSERKLYIQTDNQPPKPIHLGPGVVDIGSAIRASNFDGFVKVTGRKLYIGNSSIANLTLGDDKNVIQEIVSRIIGPSIKTTQEVSYDQNIITHQKLRENIILSYIKEIQITEQQSDVESQTIQNILFPQGTFAKKIT